MTYKHHILAVAIAATGFSASVAANPLAGELQSLLTDHPLIKAARKTVDAADQGREAARSGYLPKLNINGDAGPENITSRFYLPGTGETITGSTPSSAVPTKSDLIRRKFAVTVEQNLFAGGKTAALVGIADIEFAAQENGFRSTTQSTLLEAITAYLQVARFETLIAIAKRNEATTQRQLHLEDERVQRGGGIAVDVLQAKARLQIAKERRVLAEQGLRDAVANYRQVFGHEPDLERIQELDTLATGLPKSLEAAIELSHTENPAIREALLLSKKAQKQIGLESSGNYPTIDLVGSQAYDRDANQVASRDERNLLLRMNWNLFSGFETRSRTNAATSTYGATLDREVAVLRKTEESVRIAWHQLVNGRERQELLENAANISYEVMKNRQRLRDAGKETAINVLDSEVEYYGVLTNSLNAIYDTRLGGYRLLAATGNLSPELLGLTDGKLAIPVKPLNIAYDEPASEIAAAKADKASAAAAPAAPRAASSPNEAQSAARAALDAWLAAWSARNVEAYLAAYAAELSPKAGMSRSAWEKQRASRIGEAKWIKVTADDVKIEPTKPGVLRVTFSQTYASDRVTETSAKTLDFVQDKGAWKIVSER